MYDNRLMHSDESIDLFENSMVIVAEYGNVDNINGLLHCLDDNTEHPEVMSGVLHIIDALWDIHPSKSALIVLEFVNREDLVFSDWMMDLFYRLLNNQDARTILVDSVYLLSINNRAFLTDLLKRMLVDAMGLDGVSSNIKALLVKTEV